METINVEQHGQVAVLKLNRGITNAINLQLVNELTRILQSVKQDSQVGGLVLGSANDKFFSIGFDIPQLFDLTREDFATFFRAFNRACLDVYTLPKPTIAALTGHTTAGGCILALCCDYRFMAEGRKLMGLNEIKLGVPVPYLADCILRYLAGVRNARDITDTGEFYPPEQSLQMGLVDQVLPLDQVLPRSIEKAEAVGASSQEAFAMIKRNRVETIEAQILARQADKEQFFVECWYADETRRRLKEAMKKF
jgi:enoyl-CoA hydratase/carnithine racemase